jgi:hypothetical protein
VPVDAVVQIRRASAVSAVTSPGGAIAAAVSAIAAAYGRDNATVVADREFSGKVDKLANGLRLLGKFVKIYNALKLAAALTQVVVDSAPPARVRSKWRRFWPLCLSPGCPLKGRDHEGREEHCRRCRSAWRAVHGQEGHCAGVLGVRCPLGRAG